MKAIVVHGFGPANVHQVEDIAQPSAASSEVLIEVLSAGINFPDTLVVQGKYQNLPPLPFVPGKELVGRVIHAGADTKNLQVGDRVMAQVEHGAFAEIVAVKEEHCHRVPADLADTEAAAMGMVYQTAYFALVERGRLLRGETVLVNGAAGGVGIATVQIAKALGGKVLAGVNNQEHADIALENGADHVIDLGISDLHNSLREQVWEATDGRGADLVIDPLGAHVFDASLRALGWCGRLVVIGFAAGGISAVKANYLLLKNIEVIGLQWSDYRDRQPGKVSAVQDTLYELQRTGKIKPRIAKVLPLHRHSEAFDVLSSGSSAGKFVLDIRALA